MSLGIAHCPTSVLHCPFCEATTPAVGIGGETGKVFAMNTDQPSAAALVERVAEALVVLGAGPRCTYVNRQAERLLRHTSDEVVGRILWDVIPEIAQGQLPEQCRLAVKEQKARIFEERYEHFDEWWKWRLFPTPDGLDIYFTDITEHKRREEDLRSCEQSYFRLVNSLGGVAWVADGRTFQFLYVSEEATRILGYPPEQWLEDPDFWRSHLHPDDRERCIGLHLALLASGDDSASEYRMISADGRVVWFREIVSHHVEEGGRVRLRGTMMEITAQKQEEDLQEQAWQDLQERVKEFTVLVKSAHLLHRIDRSVEEVLRELVSLLPSAFQFPEAVAIRVRVGDVQVATANFRESSNFIGAESHGIDGMSCSIEVVYLEEQVPIGRTPFLPEEKQLIQAIADLARSAEHRRRINETLERRDALLQNVVDHSQDGVTILTASGKVLYQSPAMERLVGYSQDEQVDHSTAAFIHREDRKKWELFLDEVFSAGKSRGVVEVRSRNRQGKWRILESIGRRIVDDSGVAAAVINTRDITDRSEAERRLRESEARFRRLFEENGAGMAIVGTDGYILQVNRSFCRMLDCSEEDLLQKPGLSIVYPEDRAALVRSAEAVFARHEVLEQEIRYLRKDGEIVWARTSAIPFTSELGETRIIATFQDSTANKKAAEVVELSELRYRSLLLASAQIIWITDASGEPTLGNASWSALTGQTEEEYRGRGWTNALHPDDRERVLRQWAQAIQMKDKYEVEMRIRTASGEYRDFTVRGAPVWDDGLVREWIGSCTDITDRKRAENDILTWKNRYEAAIRASKQLLYDWKMSTDEVAYGGNMEAILGYSIEEMKEGAVQEWVEFVHPDDREKFRQEVELVRSTHQPFQLQYRLRQRDGTYRIVQDYGQCYLDKRGNTFRQIGFVADITERMEMENRLRASEERFRRIFEECGVGMVLMDLDQHILQVNSAYCRFLGYTEEELRFMTERELVCPEDLPGYDRAIEDVLTGKERIADLDKRCIRKDGQMVWAHLTGVFPHVGGKPAYCVAVIQDISARKKVEEELARTKRFFQSLIEGSSDNITVLSERGITLFQSPAIQRQLGYSPEELVGKNNVDLIDPEDQPKAIRRLREAIRRGETKAPQPLRFRCKDGSWRILETVGRRFVDDAGKVVGIFNTRDVTEREIANELLKRAKQQAEAANAAKDRFLASLSHELRTPLTPVVALLPELLQAPDLPNQVRSDLLMIKQNVELETRLIDDLLDVTRVTQGKVRLNRQMVDAHELVGSTLEIVRSDADAKEISLLRDYSAQCHHIWADRVRLQQVLWNVLKNAIKFSPARSRIFVGTENPEPGRIRICVRDEGAGIEPDQLPRIFDAFVQTFYGGGHQFGGLGLGLFISRAMVELHGGTIEAHSKGPGKGATFDIELATVPEGAMPQAQPTTPSQVPAKSPLRILLVEDHANTREVLTRLLKRQGHTVLAAESVEEALHVADENKLDVAISDLGLPDGSGLDLMPKLRSRYGLKGIAVSGYGMEGDLKSSRDAGFGAHLVKPIDFTQLQTALQEITGPNG